MKKIASAILIVACLALSLPQAGLAQTTDDVWTHHIDVWVARDLDGIVSDYTDDSVLILNNKLYLGTDEIRNVFSQLFSIFDNGDNVIDEPIVLDRYVYIIWHFTPNGGTEHYGTDTFLIEDGVITLQTIASTLYDEFPIAHLP